MIFYRYESRLNASFYGEEGYFSYPLSVKVELVELFLHKETDKSYWLVHDWDKDCRHPKIIRKSAKKKYAWETKDLALKSFIKRRESQIRILENELKKARAGLNIANSMKQIEI